MALVAICILHDKEGCNSVWPTKLPILLGLHKDWAADGLIPCKPDIENQWLCSKRTEQSIWDWWIANRQAS